MKRYSFESVLDKNGRMVIDGSMSTALEGMGAKLKSGLWTAAVLAENPEMVKQVHINYFKAGADCGISCSYQATIKGFTERGYSEERAEKIIAGSIHLLLEARDEWWEREGKASSRPYPLCLASVGPYGAYLADGSEYRGNYKISEKELREFHEKRIRILWDAGADLLLFETLPSFSEACLLADIAESIKADYWISFSCRDESRISDGTPITDCVKALSSGHPYLKAVGVNCTRPEYVVGLIRRIKQCTDLPVAVYPNSGYEYDPKVKAWIPDSSSKDFKTYAAEYFKAGANAVGGCCTAGEDEIRKIAEVRDAFSGISL